MFDFIFLSCFPVGALTTHLSWMNKCLVGKRLMLSASREMVWRNFHAGLCENIAALMSLTSGNKPAASMVCLKLMKTLVKANYSPPGSTQRQDEEPMTSKEEDVITYIAGYLLKKLQHYQGTSVLTTTEASGYLAAKDRGGLTRPSSEFVAVIYEMERAFRELPLKSAKLSDFQEILLNYSVHFNFFILLDEVHGTTENKELFYIDLCSLFFVVRIHQKCRNIVDKYIQSTKISRKSKALRDTV